MTRSRPDEGWASLTEDELREELEARGLSAAGPTDELVARLEAAEAGEEEAGEEEAGEEEAGEPAAADEAGEEEAGEPTAADEAGEEEAGEPTAADEAGEEEAGEPAAPTPEERSEPGRRRGAAETSTVTARRPAPRRPDGAVVVRARAKYVRSAPRKARLVMEHIRGRPVEQARAILVHTPRSVSVDVLKLLNSAVANAESNYELAADELRVRRAFVDEGPTIKRYRPRALGRATRINKRTSHMTIELTTAEDGRR